MKHKLGLLPLGLELLYVLPSDKEFGMLLSPTYQLIPEQSTAAIIAHHPQAKYYNIGESRVKQLMKQTFPYVRSRIDDC